MHGLLRRGRDASQGVGKACGGRERGPYVSALTEASPPAACRGAHPPGRGPPAFRSPAAPGRDGAAWAGQREELRPPLRQGARAARAPTASGRSASSGSRP